VAKSTIAPYRNSANSQSFSLVTTGATGSTWKVAGRDLALPYVVEIQRKLTSSGASGNDHIIVRVARTERNATTMKLATAQCLLDISIPKDTTLLTQTVQKEIVSILASVLNEETAMEATNANITALVSGGDF